MQTKRATNVKPLAPQPSHCTETKKEKKSEVKKPTHRRRHESFAFSKGQRVRSYMPAGCVAAAAVRAVDHCVSALAAQVRHHLGECARRVRNASERAARQFARSIRRKYTRATAPRPMARNCTSLAAAQAPPRQSMSASRAPTARRHRERDGRRCFPLRAERATHAG